jgi:hypothetical protein
VSVKPAGGVGRPSPSVRQGGLCPTLTLNLALNPLPNRNLTLNLNPPYGVAVGVASGRQNESKITIKIKITKMIKIKSRIKIRTESFNV